MNILDNFLQNFRSKKTEAPVLHTPHGDLNLAKTRDRKKFQRTVFEIQRVTDALTQQDIGDWRRAWQMALNVDSPNRVKLYDIYRDVDADPHLSGCTTQRRGFVMSRSFKLVNASGDEDEKARHYFDQSWFKHCLLYTSPSPRDA